MNKKKLRLLFATTTVILLVAEIAIAVYASGWIRNYLAEYMTKKRY